MRYLAVMMLCVLVSGCKNAEPATPKEQEEQEQRMRYFLNETSPRNMNDHPKVTPEFKKTFNTKSSKQDSADSSDTKGTREEKEAW